MNRFKQKFKSVDLELKNDPFLIFGIIRFFFKNLALPLLFTC